MEHADPVLMVFGENFTVYMRFFPVGFMDNETACMGSETVILLSIEIAVLLELICMGYADSIKNIGTSVVSFPEIFVIVSHTISLWGRPRNPFAINIGSKAVQLPVQR